MIASHQSRSGSQYETPHVAPACLNCDTPVCLIGMLLTLLDKARLIRQIRRWKIVFPMPVIFVVISQLCRAATYVTHRSIFCAGGRVNRQTMVCRFGELRSPVSPLREMHGVLLEVCRESNAKFGVVPSSCFR